MENNEDNIKETVLQGSFTSALVNTLTPNSKNFARIMAFKDECNGPSSNIIEIKTPEGFPGPVQSLNVFPLGPNSLMLQWERMILTNGLLKGYRIFYEEMPRVDSLGPRLEREPTILNSNATQAKLTFLKPNTKYRIHIVGFTMQGNGEEWGDYVNLKL